MPIRILIFTLAGTIFIGAISFFSNLNASVDQKIYLKLENKNIPLLVVSTSETRALGLAGVERLPEDSAMLFTFNEPDYYGIWMKDMKFPIDILWLDENYKIIHMEVNIFPKTYPKIFLPPEKSLYVLEANSGFAKKNNLKMGEILNFSQKL